jgi:TQXA domain-containing protein
MITAQRQRRRRRAATVVASLAAATGLVVGLAAPAIAASVAVYNGPSDGENLNIQGTWPDNSDEGDEPQTLTQRAGLFDLTIDGDTEGKAYCIDINTLVPPGSSLDEIDWATSGVDNLEQVGAILRHYYPNGDGPDGQQITGSNADKAAATQAAIWHYTDGYELTDGAPNTQVVIDNYGVILTAVEGGLEGFGEPTVTLSITPPASTEADAGELVGPYVVNTSADSVTLTPSAGVSLHNEDGSPFTDAVVDGTQVWLKSDVEGAGTISATAEAEIGSGRVFFTEGVQRLVLASTVTTDATAEATVNFLTPPPTTTTTAPETTTTTVPITVQTTVVTEAPTTTVPIVPSANTGGGLPVTGAQSLVLVGVALALVVTGAGFGIVSRRKRLEG